MLMAIGGAFREMCGAMVLCLAARGPSAEPAGQNGGRRRARIAPVSEHVAAQEGVPTSTARALFHSVAFRWMLAWEAPLWLYCVFCNGLLGGCAHICACNLALLTCACAIASVAGIVIGAPKVFSGTQPKNAVWNVIVHFAFGLELLARPFSFYDVVKVLHGAAVSCTYNYN